MWASYYPSLIRIRKTDKSLYHSLLFIVKRKYSGKMFNRQEPTAYNIIIMFHITIAISIRSTIKIGYRALVLSTSLQNDHFTRRFGFTDQGEHETTGALGWSNRLPKLQEFLKK